MLLNWSDDNIRWKFVFRSYFQDIESVIPKYSRHTGAVTDSLKTATQSQVSNRCNKMAKHTAAALIDYLLIYFFFLSNASDM